MSKIEMQLAIHRTDQSKFFPVSVLLQYARGVLCLALRDFGMLCPDSDSLRRASSRARTPWRMVRAISPANLARRRLRQAQPRFQAFRAFRGLLQYFWSQAVSGILHASRQSRSVHCTFANHADRLRWGSLRTLDQGGASSKHQQGPSRNLDQSPT